MKSLWNVDDKFCNQNRYRLFLELNNPSNEHRSMELREGMCSVNAFSAHQLFDTNSLTYISVGCSNHCIEKYS